MPVSDSSGTELQFSF